MLGWPLGEPEATELYNSGKRGQHWSRCRNRPARLMRLVPTLCCNQSPITKLNRSKGLEIMAKLPKAGRIGGGSSNIGASSGDIAREGDGYAWPNGDGITAAIPGGNAKRPGI